MTAKKRGGSTSSSAKAVARARSSDRRTGMLWIGAVLAVVVFAAVTIVWAVKSPDKQRPEAADAGLRGPPAVTAAGQVTPPPWPVPNDTPAAVRAAGLPMLPEEGVVEHIHAHLDVLVDGQPVQVPAFIGIDQARGTISPLHTHDAGGVVHIESPVKRAFSLGELFTEWDVSLSADSIGALRATNGKELRVFVDGAPRPGNPAAITFSDHDEIAVVYGAPRADEYIPDRYDFPSGL